MKRKIVVLRKERKRFYALESTSTETHLIAKILTDLCRNEFINTWIKDNHYNRYIGNCSLLIKENDTMAFQPLYYEEKNPDTFICSREAFIKLIDQWNSARKENKEFIIIELDEKDTINLYASDKVPDDYPFELPPILKTR